MSPIKRHQKESRCYLETGEWTRCPHNLLADWSREVKKSKHTFTENQMKKKTAHMETEILMH